MSDAIEVHIDVGSVTRMVGLLRYQTARHESSVFEYAETWLQSEGAFSVDPAALPLQSGPFYQSGATSALPGAIRDTAPDRWGQLLIRRAMRKSGEERTLSAIDYLLAINDATRIGSLRYRRPGERAFEHDIGRFRVPPLVSLPALLQAADAVRSNSETAADLRLLLNEGSPLGGARPKSAVVDDKGQLAIAKFPKADDERSIPLGEMLALTLAKQAGINVASARVIAVKERPVVLITRFDRAESQQRIPFVSAMTMLGLKDGDEATYTDIAEVIRMHSAEPIQDLHELWRRLVFNVLTSNLDDHLRNHGFLYERHGKWRLSPAYDLNPVPVEEKARELTTWISEDGPEASLDLAFDAASYFALNPEDAHRIVAEVSAVTTKWCGTARRIKMSSMDIAAYASAFKVVNE